jgi:predicted dithiol-disulfide oxidoreductase (DUF899 family)
MITDNTNSPRVVSRDEWLQARQELLTKEKQLTRQSDAVTLLRRQLPWVKVEKDYLFNGPNGRETLADLFAGKSQLIVYHFMFGPEWQEGCPRCSYNMDHVGGALVHLAQRDVTFTAISRAPFAEIEAFKKRMGWAFNWVSSYESDFNYDFHVSFTEEELAMGKVYYNFDMTEFGGSEAPGISVFYRDTTGEIFHTYSGYARALDILIGTYNYLDFVPKGRDEDTSDAMSWVRYHDRYDDKNHAY